jgi:predicted ATP-grasp superfamily ATP-dependent carboligase
MAITRILITITLATHGIDMINVFTINNEYDSACRLGYQTFTYRDNYVEEYDSNVNIRWGNSGLLLNKNGNEVDFKRVINPAHNISFNCRKNKSLKKLAEVVLTPKIYEENVPDGELVVVRPMEHAGGSDFSVKTGPFTLEIGYQYATQYIKTKTEYRVWFINGKTLCAKRACSRDKSKYPCRSEWGYIFCPITKQLHDDTVRAALHIGLEVGAADVLSKNGHYYFLELNSAPTIDMMRIERFYKRNLVKLIAKKFPDIRIENENTRTTSER